LSCKHCQRKVLTNTGTTASGDGGNVRWSAVYVNYDDPNCCPRCGKRVYFAEQVLSLGRKWHRRCFSCCK